MSEAFERFAPQGFVGRTIVAVEMMEPEGRDSEAYFTLDDGNVVTIQAGGWHDSGSLSFWARGVSGSKPETAKGRDER